MGFEVREPVTRYAPPALVIDNSVAMRWCVASGKPGEQRYAKNVRDYLSVEMPRVLVPYLWTYEAANVMAYYVRRREIEHGAAHKTLRALHDLFTIVIDRGETPMALLDAAHRHGITTYDAAYLLLAQGEDLPIATLDRKMRRVASAMGISVFKP